MMDAAIQDRVARAMAAVFQAEGIVWCRSVYVNGKLARIYEPGAHELLAILTAAGCQPLPDKGTVQADPRQLVLIP